jgi:hypothetical protein
MSKNKENNTNLGTGDINQVNKFISRINRYPLGQEIEILSNDRVRIKAVLLTDADPSQVHINIVNGVPVTGKILHDIVRKELGNGGLKIGTKSGEVVRIYQESIAQTRDEMEAVISTHSSIPAPA